MESAATLTTTTWIVWALIGFIGGFMLGRARGGSRAVVLNVIVGVVFALAGGWVFCYLFGAGEQMQYLSLVVSVVTTAIGLWIFTKLSRPRKVNDDEFPQ